MKTNAISALKLLLSDRLLTVLIILLVIISLAYCVYVGISLRPSDLQVAIHYTAFGEATFYRDKWYYFISFITFGIILATIHPALGVKLYTQGRRQIALLFICLSLLLVAIAWLITWSILRIAFL